MSNFEYAFDEVIGLEGGYVNDTGDHGGETKWGVSKRSYPNVDIKNLTKEEAKQIYWKDFWNKLLLTQVGEVSVALEIFEQAVNLGRKQAGIHVQGGLQLLGEIVDQDGWIGQQTIAAINRLGQARTQAYLKILNGFQFMKYLEIVTNDPTQKKYFVGWLRRIAIYG